MAAGLGGPGVQDRGVEGRIMAEQQFCLRWNNFQSNIVSSFENLLDKEEFVDVTLTAEGKSLKAHKVLLSACSPYFRELFRDLPQHQHPVIVLRDTGFLELKSLLSFIYHGEVNVSQDRLGLLLKTAESLRIKGLAQDKRAKDFEQFGTFTTSPSKEGEETIDHLDRERRALSPNNNSPALNLGYSSLSNSSLPPPNLLVPLEPPSHKSPILHQSPPAKKRKTPHSPHTGTRTHSSMTPGHTPPGHATPGHTPQGHTPPGHTPPSSGGPLSVLSLRELSSSHAQSTPHRQMPPLQHTTPASSSSSSLPSSEEDNKVVNLSIGGNGTLSRPHSPSLRIVPKLEVGDDEGVHLPPGIMLRERDRDGGVDSDQEMSEEREPPPSHHDDDSRENSESNSASQDMIHLPTHLPVQTYVPYGASQLETYPGPSGVISSASQAAAWRGSSHSEPPQEDALKSFSSLASPISLFFPPRTWSPSSPGIRPSLSLLSSMNFSSSCSSDLSSLRPKALRPSHRPANCPACGRYFTFGHNMKAHLKRCPKNPQRPTVVSTEGSVAISDNLSNPPSPATSPSRLQEALAEALEKV